MRTKRAINIVSGPSVRVAGLFMSALIVVLALSAALSSLAYADPYFIDPSTKQDWQQGVFWAKVNVANGEVTDKSKPLYFAGSDLKFDGMANFICSAGEFVKAIYVKTTSGFEATRKYGLFNGSVSGKFLRYEAFYGIKFASKQDLVNSCKAGRSSYDLDVIMKFSCFDEGVLWNSYSYEQGGKKLTMKLECVDEVNSTVTEHIKLSCPIGFWLQGTTEREHIFKMDTRFPVNLDQRICVPEGTPAGPKG